MVVVVEEEAAPAAGGQSNADLEEVRRGEDELHALEVGLHVLVLESKKDTRPAGADMCKRHRSKRSTPNIPAVPIGSWAFSALTIVSFRWDRSHPKAQLSSEGRKHVCHGIDPCKKKTHHIATVCTTGNRKHALRMGLIPSKRSWCGVSGDSAGRPRCRRPPGR